MNDLQRMIQEIICLIKSGNMSVEELEKLLKSVEDQLVKYKKALDLIEEAGAENWTYEAYVESVRLGSGSEAKVIVRGLWDQMFTKHKLELRDDAISIIQEGQRNFEEIKATIETELSKGKK